MNRDLTNSKLTPTQIITIYNDPNQKHFYLEHRGIQHVEGKPTLLAPTPMGEDVFRAIAQAFIMDKAANMRFEGLIPEHILYSYNKLGKTVIIWYRPAMKRCLNFSSSAITIKGDSTAEVPATLYVLIDSTLYIYALMTSERPNAETKIYNAPFLNIYQDGRVCLGTARIGKKEKTFTLEAERFERAFYMAEQNGGTSLKNCKTPLNKLWPSLIKEKKPFPSKELIQHSKYKTLGSLIQNLIGKLSHED